MVLKGGFSRLVIQDCGTSVYYTCLAIAQGKFCILVHIYVLTCVNLFDGVAAFSDNNNSHCAGFINDHPADFWIGPFSSPCCFIFFEFYILPSGNL